MDGGLSVTQRKNLVTMEWTFLRGTALQIGIEACPLSLTLLPPETKFQHSSVLGCGEDQVTRMRKSEAESTWGGM